MSGWLTTREVAQLLRLRPRTVYHFVARGDIPHSRARGRLLFDRETIDRWLAGQSAGTIEGGNADPPATIAGSHDPLLEWAVRESRCGLALATVGSVEGVERFVARGACAALVHIPDAEGDGFNGEVFRARLGRLPTVALHWARREQGLVVAPGNPLGIRCLADAARRRARFAMRQPGAGSHLLLARLLRTEGVAARRLRQTGAYATSETDVADAVAEGYADTGLAIRAAVRRDRLEFVPLAWEIVDLVVWRRSCFEAPIQALLEFTRSRRFARHADALGGYDLAACRQVRFNA